MSTVSGSSIGGENSSLELAARWIEGVLLGTTATLVAIIAVAGLGYLLLTGRVDLRRGATVVLGCFILFGAPVIAGALYRLAVFDGQPAPYTETQVDALPPVPVPAPQPAPTAAYDPYAGASVPNR
ncbi:TrbC/VirB2 family protein [Sphingomonas sp. OV641]|jgi:type IV secretory pathway VirB2 component (pilin)|uniref:TrbC/VirB2 family protein n=1 Tax=Sphingomonas sp. OV641 TaxID=1881068 RepID=UPI000B8634CE|nr:TrbC/VirB2 family protein [Sphingomonas sp. OV641]